MVGKTGTCSPAMGRGVADAPRPVVQMHESIPAMEINLRIV